MATSVPPNSRRALRHPRAVPRRIGQAPVRNPVHPTRSRMLLVGGILLAATLGLVANLVRLQIIHASELKEKAQAQQQVYLRPFVPRRPIVDRDGNVIAVDQPVATLYVHPKLFKEPPEAIAEKLAPIVALSPAELLKRFSAAQSGIELIENLPEDSAARVTALGIDGLELVPHQMRLYPQQELFADVLGYVNVDRQGQAGVEYSQQKILERHVQALRVSRMGDGTYIPTQVPGGFLHNDDLQLQLTIDGRLQRAARAALKQQISRFNAKRGGVIVMDVRDGALLVMASEPTYDPNRYYDFSIDRFRNWLLSDLYEPGSTFKPINVAIALEAGVIEPNTQIYDEGQIFVDSWPISNFDYSSRGARGNLSIAEILEVSSNVGMVHIVERLKPEVYYGWLERIGLGQPLGSDLPFEVSGQLKSREQFLGSPVEAATTAFGQGFSLTPLQLVQLEAAIANGGKLVTPHVVRGLRSTDGKMHWQPDYTPRPIFAPENAQAVLGMMENVVKNGTGEAAQIPGYRIAGKTGTAQKANPNGGYYENAKITSFVGIVPVEAPRYVVLAVIDEPQGGDAFGSTVAAPIVKSVMEVLLASEGIPAQKPTAP